MRAKILTTNAKLCNLSNTATTYIIFSYIILHVCWVCLISQRWTYKGFGMNTMLEPSSPIFGDTVAQNLKTSYRFMNTFLNLHSKIAYTCVVFNQKDKEGRLRKFVTSSWPWCSLEWNVFMKMKQRQLSNNNNYHQARHDIFENK